MAEQHTSEELNVGDEIILGRKELRDALCDGTPLEERFTVHRVEQPAGATPADPDAT